MQNLTKIFYLKKNSRISFKFYKTLYIVLYSGIKCEFAVQLSRGGETDSLIIKKFLQEPDLDPEPNRPSKPDPEPKKIIPDPQH
jgi:hypothetical protein